MPSEISLPKRDFVEATATAELGPALWSGEVHMPQGEVGKEVIAPPADAKVAAAHRLADAIENDAIVYADGYAAAGEFLGKTRPRAKEKLIAALRAMKA